MSGGVCGGRQWRTVCTGSQTRGAVCSQMGYIFEELELQITKELVQFALTAVQPPPVYRLVCTLEMLQEEMSSATELPVDIIQIANGIKSNVIDQDVYYTVTYHPAR